MKKTINAEFLSHIKTFEDSVSTLLGVIEDGASLIVEALKNGNKILICGNGGSAADSQHFAAELTGRYKVERRALSAIALSTDTSALSAIGNDYGFEFVFSRQVEALAKSGDIVFGISTSGNSQNVIRAIEVAKKNNCKVVGLLGRDGGKIRDLCDVSIVVPSNDTARVQEVHIFIIHLICNVLDTEFKNI